MWHPQGDFMSAATQLPTWAVYAVALGTPILAFLGAIIGHVITRRGAKEQEQRSRREKLMKTLQWAAELAISDDQAKAPPRRTTGPAGEAHNDDGIGQDRREERLAWRADESTRHLEPTHPQCQGVDAGHQQHAQYQSESEIEPPRPAQVEAIVNDRAAIDPSGGHPQEAPDEQQEDDNLDDVGVYDGEQTSQEATTRTSQRRARDP